MKSLHATKPMQPENYTHKTVWKFNFLRKPTITISFYFSFPHPPTHFLHGNIVQKLGSHKDQFTKLALSTDKDFT